MLAHIDARNAEAVGYAREDHVPVPGTGQNEIDRADHDRPPDEEDGKLAEAPVFEGIGVGQKHQRAEGKHRDGYGVEVGVNEGVETCQDRQHAADNEPGELLPLGPEALNKRMHTVLRAEVVVLIDTAAEIGVVVQEVVGAMRDEEPERHDDPRYPGEMAVAPGEQTGDHTGVYGYEGYGGTCCDQPLGDDVERVPLLFYRPS